MLWITCPRCGSRSVDEYAYGGEFPSVPERITDPDERIVDYVWMQNNPAGTAKERWFHESGCRRWCTVERNTSTDDISSVS